MPAGARAVIFRIFLLEVAIRHPQPKLADYSFSAFELIEYSIAIAVGFIMKLQ